MTPSRRQTAGMTGCKSLHDSCTSLPHRRYESRSIYQRVVINQPGRNTRRQVALIAYADIISARVTSGKQPRFRNRLNDPPTKKYNTHKSPNARNKGRLTPGTMQKQGCHSSICGLRAEQTQQDTEEYRPGTVMQAVMEHGHSNGIHQKADIQYHRNHSRQGPSHSNLTTRHQISSWCAERHVEPKPVHAITTPS